MMAQIVVALEKNGLHRAMSSGMYDPRCHNLVETFIGEVKVYECDRLNYFYVVAVTTEEVAERLAGSGLVRLIEDGQYAVSLTGAL